MREKIARKLTETLRHHGVEMHPDDIRGLAEDAISAMREPTDAVMMAGGEQLRRLVPGLSGEDASVAAYGVLKAMAEAAKEER